MGLFFMKMFGSTYSDSLFGTDGVDTIRGNDGADLISAWYTGQVGAADQIYGEDGRDLISGFTFNLDNLAKSPSRGAYIDGGSGRDSAIIHLEASSQTVVIGRLHSAFTIKHVEDVIYHFDSLGPQQRVMGTDRGETFYYGESSAHGLGGDGNDYLFSGQGDDALEGGNGNDLLSAAGGHNILTGGKGSDYFQFQITEDYQYSEITDFQKGTDKIAMSLDTGGVELGPKRSYGDGFRMLDRPIDLLGYLDYDNGRYFDREDFKSNDKLFEGQMIYEQKTGSLLQRLIFDDGQGGDVTYNILIAHIDGNPHLTADDFKFMIV